MEAPFPHFKPSEPDGHLHFRMTQRSLLAPLYASLVLMLAQSGPPGPGLWMVFGCSAGLSLLLSGIHRMCYDKDTRTRWGQRLCEHGDTYIPWTLFGARSASIALTASLFWIGATEHGLPNHVWLHVMFGTLLIVHFVYQWASSVAEVTERPRWISAAEFLRYTFYSLVAVLAGGIITFEIAPPGHRIPSDQYLFVVFLWIAVALVPLICSLLWANHLLNRQAMENQTGPK